MYTHMYEKKWWIIIINKEIKWGDHGRERLINRHEVLVWDHKAPYKACTDDRVNLNHMDEMSYRLLHEKNHKIMHSTHQSNTSFIEKHK